MSVTVKLASIGLGWWGKTLAAAATASGEAEIVSCFVRNEENRKRFAEENGCRAAGSLAELWGDSEVQGVLIATANLSHRPLIEAAAAAGKHVFVEKPLTLNVEDGRACIAAAEGAGVVLQVGHQRRRTTANRRIKQMIEAGDLGDVHALETNQSVPNGLKMPPEAWRWKPEESPLGAMASLGSHKIDTMHYLAGPVRSVFAYTRSGRDYPIDEVTVLALEFESGALGTLITSFFVPVVSRVAVFGTGGSAFGEADGHKLFLHKTGEAAPEQLDIEPNDPVVDQMVEFARAVRGEVEPETGGAAGLAVVAVMQAAEESSRTGKAVDVAPYREAAG